jgi:hypothetical protein
VVASKASISLKSVFSNPFTRSHFHELPPSIERAIIPLLPLAQIILSDTTLNPRIDVFSPEVSILRVCEVLALQ